MRAVAPIVLAACWTGGDEPAVTMPPARSEKPFALEVTLERTPCFGACPAYTVTIHGDGSVAWLGASNVAAVGPRTGRISRRQLVALDHAIDAAHFFVLDEEGHRPTQPACITVGNAVTCTFSASTGCSDTPHAILTVRRGTQVHRVDDAQCSDEPSDLERLEELVDRLAGAGAWR